MNVLFVICDDLNDWVLHPKDHPQVKTPHIDRLRERSVSFTNAHAAVPVCGPSRKCLFSGLYPQTIDSFDFAAWKSVSALKECVPLPLHFRHNGYDVFGTSRTPIKFCERITILHHAAHRSENNEQPTGYLRHYYDVCRMAKTPVKDGASADLRLLEAVVAFKDKFYYRGWAEYTLAKPGTMRLSLPCSEPGGALTGKGAIPQVGRASFLPKQRSRTHLVGFFGANHSQFESPEAQPNIEATKHPTFS